MTNALSGRYTSLAAAILLACDLTLGGADLMGAPPDRFGDPLPEGALALLGTTRFRQGLAVTSRALFSRDGKKIASAGTEHGVYLWDAVTGRLLRRLTDHTLENALAFSPDGKLLAAEHNMQPALFDAASGARLSFFHEGSAGEVGLASVAFGPDSRSVAIAHFQGGISVWDVDARSRCRMRYEKQRLDARCVAFAPRGKLLASAGKDGVVYLWDPATGNELGRLSGHERPVSTVAFSPNGRLLASSGEDHTVRLWEVAGRKVIRVLDDRALVWKQGQPGVAIPSVGIRARSTLAFSPDGKTLATGHGDGTVILWDVRKGEEVRRWHAHHFTPSSLDFSPDGRTLLSMAYWESVPRVWDVATGKEVLPLAGHDAPVDDLYFSADGKSLRSLGRDMVLLRWDLASGSAAVGFRHPRWALDGCKVSPRGDRLATWAHGQGDLQLRDTLTGKALHSLGKFPGRNRYGFRLPLVFSQDGRRLAFGSVEEHKVFIWDTATGRQLQRIKELEGEITCVAFSPDGGKIAVGSGRRSGALLALWDVAGGKQLAAFSPPALGDSLAFSPDGRVLACGMWFGPARLWDTEVRQELRPLRSAAHLVALAFSPDGKWLAGVGGVEEQEIHLWEVNTGLKVRSFQGHLGTVLSVAFAPDGRSLATGGSDSMILVWDFTGRREHGGRQTAKWTEAELEQQWRDLASRDGPKAVQALWDLADSPEQTVPLLRQRIKPAQPLDPERVQQWIRDLDSDDFQARTVATRKLEAMVDVAEPALWKALEESPGLEARRRIEQVLHKLEALASPERLRALRAIQVLEYAGTSEARQLLRDLAHGAAGVRLTREATAALERMPHG
jgi:WD40 repeat protein